MQDGELDFYDELHWMIGAMDAGRILFSLTNGEKVLVDDVLSISLNRKLVGVYESDGNVILLPFSSICSAQILPFIE